MFNIGDLVKVTSLRDYKTIVGTIVNVTAIEDPIKITTTLYYDVRHYENDGSEHIIRCSKNEYCIDYLSDNDINWLGESHNEEQEKEPKYTSAIIEIGNESHVFEIKSYKFEGDRVILVDKDGGVFNAAANNITLVGDLCE